MLGYWNPKTQATEPLMDEWLDTGDYVAVSPEDGQFKILGRADDRLVLSNGRKLFPVRSSNRCSRSRAYVTRCCWLRIVM